MGNNHDQQSEQLNEQERRTGSDRERDRRVIERVSMPEARPHLTLIRRLCQVGAGFAVVYILTIMAGHVFPQPNMELLARSVFVATVVAVMAYQFLRLAGSIKSYQENESKQRLLLFIERLRMFMFVSVSIGVILGIVHIITWIR